MKRLTLILLAALALSGAAAQPLPPPLPPVDSGLLRAAEASGTVRVMVKFAPPETRGTPRQVADAMRLFRLGLVSGTRGVARLVANSETWTIPYAAIEVDAAALQAIAATPGVTAVSLDQREYLHLESALPLINIDDAHARGVSEDYDGLTGEGWTIVILDIGIQADHSFFGGRVVDEACFSTDFPSVDNPDPDPDIFGAKSLCPNGNETQFGPGAAATTVCGAFQACSHGTHVAGIAAGKDETRSGVAPGANIIMLNVFSQGRDLANQPIPGDTFTYVSDQVGALQHVVNTLDATYKIASVNMSLGGGAFAAACDSDADATQQARIDAINLLNASDIGVVISSGNEASTTTISRPGCVSSAITVSAITDGGSVASFANSNGLVDFYAPGNDITSSGLGGTFFEQDGTSMAAPFVAGAIAVMKQAAPNAQIGEIVNALTATGQTITDIRPGATIANQAPLIKVDLAIDVLRGDADYLYNGDFETAGIDNKTPDGWTRAGGAIRKCDKLTKEFTPYGDCMAQLKLTALGAGKLTQNIDSPRGIFNDTITLLAKAKPKNLVSGKLVLTVKGVDNIKSKVKLNITGTFDWPAGDLASAPLVLNETVKSLKLVISMSGGGKLWLDDVQVLLDKVNVEVP